MIRQWTCVLWIAGVACTSVKTDDTAAGGAVVDPTDDTGTSVVDTGCDDPVDLYYDADGDGYGDDALMVSTCDSPAGHVTQGGDCDDIDPEVNPGAEEQCNEQDDNCNEEVDEGLSPTSWYADLDGDGYGDPSDVLSSCDVIAERVEDSSDCDDSDSLVHPGAEEVCNSQDDDCDSEIDEDLELYRYYADSDGDGYGDPETFLDSCSKPDDFVTDNTDCNDTDVSAFPGGIEVLDGVDNDCNGVIDDLKVYDADIRINGEIGASGFGYVLSGGSDMTDDGTPDLLIGSNSANSAVIVSGNLAAGEYDHDESIVQIFGVDSGSMFGSAVTMLDDFNGDGHPDVAIGAFEADVSESLKAGEIYLFFGPMSGVYDSDDADMTHSGPDLGPLGRVVADGGDLLGTGTSTLVMPIYPVTRGSDVVRLLTYVEGDGGEVATIENSIWGPDGASSFGASVHGVGDINGDGVADLAVGAPYASGAVDMNGSIFVFEGPIVESVDAEDADSRIDGSLSGDGFGSAVCGRGDWDGDGLMDIAVGAPGTGGSSWSAYVLAGGSLPASGTASSDSIALFSGLVGRTGSSVALDGDVDGDGHADVLVGAPYLSDASGESASVALFFGGESGVWDSGDAEIEAAASEDSLGIAVAYVGDTAGLGVDSISVGGHGASVGAATADAAHTGAVWIMNSGF